MKTFLKSKNTRIGGYSLILSVIVFCILAAVNVFTAELPATLTQYDISAARIYSLTSDTKAVVNNLEEDVSIYWIVQAGKEDGVLEKMLNIYDAMSDHIHVEKKDPDVYPTFAAQYTDQTVSNNSLVVAAKDKSRYISYENIYEQEMSDNMDGSVAMSFDGEEEITSSINYVVSTDMPQIYVLEGHGEKELSSEFRDEIEKANMETQSFSLLKVDSVPEEADAVLIQAPESDISDKEAEMLRKYVEGGGKLMVFSGPQENAKLTNLQSLIEDYGVHPEEGIVIEGSRDGYAFSAPYILLPKLGSSDLVQPLIAEHRNIILPLAQGLRIDNSDKARVHSLADSSDESFSKLDGFALKDYIQDESDPSGPFTLGVSIKRKDNDGKIIWIASDYVMDEMYDSYSSGGNTDLVMNALSWEIGDSNAITIRSKSLNASYLTISASDARRIKLVMIFLIPAIYLVYGLDEVVRRRAFR